MLGQEFFYYWKKKKKKKSVPVQPYLDEVPQSVQHVCKQDACKLSNITVFK